MARQAVLPLLASLLLATAPPSARADTLTDLLLPESQEKQLAEAEHPKIVAQFGGAYKNAELERYVNALASRLGKVSDRPDIKYRVTILNSPVVNAFALPAGYLYVTRGLLALAQSEAELAGVLGHEIGHVAARHVAQRYSRAIVAQGLVGLIGFLTKGTAYQGLGNLAEPLTMMALESYSRAEEDEADRYGVSYMSRAGYDPSAMARFLSTLEAVTRFEAALAGEPNPDGFDFLASHPRTADRVAKTIEEAKLAKVERPTVNRALYLEKIDGLLYGDDPDQGFVRGHVFAHPRLGFRFEVPDGFTILNGVDEVIARGQGQALIRFDQATLDADLSPERFLSAVWMQGRPIDNFEPLAVNGLPAATATARLQREAGGPLDLRLVAIKGGPTVVYRFLFVATPQLTARYGEAFKATIFSFRGLTPAERATLTPYRIRTLRVQPGEGIESLARRLPYADHRVERLRILNGLKPDEALVPGSLVKLVEGG